MSRRLTKGLFLSFEGIEGSGKSTQAKLLTESLASEGYDVVLTQEPGGTAIGERIRALLLDPAHTEMCSASELLLYAAARAQHLEQKIRPALARSAVVITDRFSDSTVAYQGYARGIDRGLLDSVDAVATRRLRPDITFLCDLPAEIGLERNREINKRDRLELEALAFHRKVREGFLQLAAAEPNRVRIVDAGQPIEMVAADVARIVTERLWALTK
ncbi:MAG TPA: dTMP kinase [Dissulfurispiraceae bacterium]|nr:dTMP kinase [Dissulfurispiraceae bacterium]